MEKTVTIDGKQVRFKATGGTMLRYKLQFGREYLADVAQLQKIIDSKSMEDMDTLPFYRILWVLAKTADDSIPDMLEWFESFSNFPVFDVIPEITELLANNIKIDRKN